MGAAIARAGLKKNWAPGEDAFRRLLRWLDDGIDSGGERYVEMRRRLESFFERRNCAGPEDLADETLNRVARRLEEEGTITATCPAQYCYIVAKHVFYESLRNGSPASPLRGELRSVDDDRDPTAAETERLFACLDGCLAQLPEEDRNLILEYYRGEQREKIDRRRELAARLGVTNNALSIRACRLRDKLEECVRRRAEVPDAFPPNLSYEDDGR